MTKKELSSLLQLAIQTVRLGGNKAKEYFRTSLHVTLKSDQSLVSIADKTVEKLMIQNIKKAYPDHQIYGEETGGSLTSNAPTWIIDPIEGTTNFVHGVPIFGSQLALMHQGRIIVSALYDPVIDILLHASRGGGAFINQDQVSLTKQSLNQTTLLFDTGRDRELAFNFLKSDIIPQFRSFRRLGSLVADAIFLCTHKTSVYLCFIGKIYDVAPISLFLKEAGYKIFDSSLNSWSPSEACDLFSCHPDHAPKIKSLLSKLINY